MTLLLSIFFLSGVTGAEPPPPAEAYAPDGELRAYLQEAGENNPGLKMLHQEWLAALERVPQMRALDDPMLTYGQFLQSDMTEFRIMLEQTFPWFGTRRARAEQAYAEAEAMLQRLYAERNRIFAEVKKAYYDYAFLGESIHVTEAQIEVLDYVTSIVESKLALGFVNQDDLLRVSIERTKVQDRRDGFLQFRPAAMSKLREALGRDDDSEIPWPQFTGLPPDLPPHTEILQRVRIANPDLRVYDHLIESRQAEIKLAEKKRFPDFTLSIEAEFFKKPMADRPDRPDPEVLAAGARLFRSFSQNMPMPTADYLLDVYMFGAGNEPMMYPERPEEDIQLALTVNVPIWRKKIRAGIQEANLRESATRYEKQMKALSLQAAAQMAIFGVEDGRRRYKLFVDSLLPQAEQTFDSLQSQYAAASYEVTFIDVLDSIQTLLDFELEQVSARRDWLVSSAELEYLTGGPWGGEASEPAEAVEAGDADNAPSPLESSSLGK